MKINFHYLASVAIFLLQSLVFAQGYDTTCNIDAIGQLHCNTQPDVLRQSEQILREWRREQSERLARPCGPTDLYGLDCTPGPIEYNIPSPKSSVEDTLGSQSLQILQLLQQQQLIEQRQQQIPMQHGILSRSYRKNGNLICEYRPANNGKFYYKGAYHDGMMYSFPGSQSKCGQRLKMAADGRGWINQGDNLIV